MYKDSLKFYTILQDSARIFKQAIVKLQDKTDQEFQKKSEREWK